MRGNKLIVFFSLFLSRILEKKEKKLIYIPEEDMNLSRDKTKKRLFQLSTVLTVGFPRRRRSTSDND